MRLYLDSSAIIYLFEGTELARGIVQQRVARARIALGEVLTSRLSWLECRVKPMRQADAALIKIYETFLSSPHLQLLDITPNVIERATDVRVTQNLRVPDAIHVATALSGGATHFLTGDKQLQRCSSLVPVEIISP